MKYCLSLRRTKNGEQTNAKSLVIPAHGASAQGTSSDNLPHIPSEFGQLQIGDALFLQKFWFNTSRASKRLYASRNPGTWSLAFATVV